MIRSFTIKELKVLANHPVIPTTGLILQRNWMWLTMFTNAMLQSLNATGIASFLYVFDYQIATSLF
jgi:hypothetical protein